MLPKFGSSLRVADGAYNLIVNTFVACFFCKLCLLLMVAELLGRRLSGDGRGLQVERNLASGAKNLFMPHELVAEQVIISST